MRHGSSASLVLAVLLIAGCSSADQPREIVHRSETVTVAPVDDATRAKVQALAMSATQGRTPGEDGYVPGETVGERLQNYSRAFQFAPGYGKDGWLLLPVEGVIYLIGLPFAAATAGPSPEDAEKARSALRPVLADSAWPAKLKEAVASVLVASGKAPRIVPEISDGVARLRLELDGPILSVRGDQGQPILLVRAMLEQNGACLADRRWQWNGVPVDYFDLADENSDALRSQIEGGLKQIGLAVAEDLFLSTTPRKTEFPGQEVAGPYRPTMSVWPYLYPNTIAAWEDRSGEATTARCGQPIAATTSG